MFSLDDFFTVVCRSNGTTLSQVHSLTRSGRYCSSSIYSNCVLLCAGCARHLVHPPANQFSIYSIILWARDRRTYLFININITQRNKIMTKGKTNNNLSMHTYRFVRCTVHKRTHHMSNSIQYTIFDFDGRRNS